jgi:hypothetical protein
VDFFFCGHEEKKMHAEDVKEFIRREVPTFGNISILGPGMAYHYTIHAELIESSGRFLGAALTMDLDRTQDPNVPRIATSDPGVVFAYRDIAEAAEEGDAAALAYPGASPELFCIHYVAAVEATHLQEAQLGASPTLLIASIDIESFERLGACGEYWND